MTELYDSYDDARTVVNNFESAGISSANISIVGRSSETGETCGAEGAAAGAGVGALAGGAGGLGMLAIPGVGPVVAAGWLPLLQEQPPARLPGRQPAASSDPLQMPALMNGRPRLSQPRYKGP